VRLRARLFDWVGMLVKVRMLTSIAGSIEARSGEIVQCDRALAARLIASGQAEPASSNGAIVSPAVEAAVHQAPETAAKPRARARRKRGAKRGGLG